MVAALVILQKNHLAVTPGCTFAAVELVAGTVALAVVDIVAAVGIAVVQAPVVDVEAGRSVDMGLVAAVFAEAEIGHSQAFPN